MKKIVTLTVNPALDVNTHINHIAPNEKLRCAPPTREPGGGGVNVSRAIHLLGGHSRAIYTYGGHIGAEYSDILKKEGVDCDGVSIKNSSRENFIIYDSGADDIYRFGMPGGSLSEEEYQQIYDKIDKLQQVDYLVASGSLPPEAPGNFYEKLAKIAKDKEIRLIIDTSGKPLSKALHHGAYLIKPNVKELEDLTGIKADNRQEQKHLAKKVVSDYNIQHIVLSLGAKGAILATKDGEIKEFDAPSVKECSAVGAGDSMVAGITFFLSQGKKIEEAVLFGLACGSAAIMTPGTELLRRKDAEELYSNMTTHQKSTVE